MDTETKVKLTPKQELFCQLFASDREFFGNGVQSYAEAYDIDITEKKGYSMARSGASENLTKPYILTRINELLDLSGFNDVAVDKQLSLVIAQSADYPSKVAAIREYNKLKARIVDKSEQLVVADVTSNGETVGTSQLDTIMKTLKDTTANEA